VAAAGDCDAGLPGSAEGLACQTCKPVLVIPSGRRALELQVQPGEGQTASKPNCPDEGCG
jgi:hypothetical protein